MNETIQFKQVKQGKGLLIAGVLFVGILALLIYFFGIIKIIDFVDNMGSGKAIGLFVAVVIVLPIFIIVGIAYPKVKVSVPWFVAHEPKKESVNFLNYKT